MPKLPRKLFTFRASAKQATADDYGDEMPSMRLSSALIVVGVLHVVAIGGIWAFNNIKTQKAAHKESASLTEKAPAASTERTTPAAATASTPGTAIVPGAAAATARTAAEPKRTVPAPIAPAASPAAKVAKTATSPAPAPAITEIKASSQTYTVAKGDNPVTIARKFKVTSEDLLALNRIDDPRKLKIGQVLKIPKSQTR